mmetsp:Transcript_19404/g.23195  ORF Transcript_19404/g.23195 Transcript_19404/m.23195 type:complete len:230 (-) Transcript_19404:408-1097(-)|eukprot:CAMPEP_0197850922 /NCGR_PEP_ID=MMETSP1438-20131217/16768_1 /TAXON_ID=1461541 /ORGANISM="Pterosperma sp., Strain CCMP1384" /LENGTH=229 /DNA_ID=CAMNT_0043464333 /DNA_START=235 /DNA_END=924 /DNA_ORIENTATION=+
MEDQNGSSGKRQFELFLSSNDLDRHFGFDDFDSDDDFRGGLQCPYCLEELCDVPALCDHLECEHPYESKEQGRRRYTLAGASASGASSSGASSSGASSSGWASHAWRQNGAGPSGLSRDGKILTPAEQELKSIAALLGVNSSGGAALSEEDEFPVLALLAREGAMGASEEPLRQGTTGASSSRSAIASAPAAQQVAEAEAAEEQDQARQEEAELQVQFVQELLLSTMGL